MIAACKRLIFLSLALGGLLGTSHWIRGFGSMEAESDEIRMERMLYQSEDLRRLRDEWRRYWSEKLPDRPTPQPVQGGIYP